MSDSIIKSTPLGLIHMEVTLEGEGSQIPTSEVLDLIRLLRETADNLEAVTQHCLKVGLGNMGVSFTVH